MDEQGSAGRYQRGKFVLCLRWQRTQGRQESKQQAELLREGAGGGRHLRFVGPGRKTERNHSLETPQQGRQEALGSNPVSSFIGYVNRGTSLDLPKWLPHLSMGIIPPFL